MELLKGLRNEDYNPLFSCGEQKVRGRFGLAFCWPYFLVMNFTVFQHLFTLLC